MIHPGDGRLTSFRSGLRIAGAISVESYIGLVQRAFEYMTMKTITRWLFCLITCWGLWAQETGPYPVTICWDASLSMQARDFGLEKAYLDNFFSQHPQSSVTLLLFSNSIWGKEQFEIKSGEWAALETKLREVRYDGATSFKELPQYCSGREVLLFTDGRQNLEAGPSLFGQPLRVINGSESADAAGLNLLALLNEGELVNLKARRIRIPAATTYYGKVYGEFADPATISLRIRGNDTLSVRPDETGAYEIQADPGEELLLFVNDRPAARQLLGATRNINIQVDDPGEIRLEEVVVTEKRKSAGEDLEQTAFGKQNRDAVGYEVASIDQSQIPDAATDATNAVQGKFSGVSLGQDDQLSQVEIRSRWSILSNNYGLVVIDGVPMAKASSSAFASASPLQKSDYIDPKNIADITVLKGLAATNRFGSLGANGVILITTKTASVSGDHSKKDLALLTNNIYDGKARVDQASLTTDYLQALRKPGNVAEAYVLYLSQRESYQDRAGYYLDLYDYFSGMAPELAFRILTNILEKEKASLAELRELLFKARQIKATGLELRTAERLLERFPGRIDSYFSLAMAKKQAGDYQEALNLLLGMKLGTLAPDLDFSPIGKSLDREISNLAFVRQQVLDLSKLPETYRSIIRYNARIIIEWDQPEASFSLRFVNPQKRFFSWEHGREADGQRMRKELEQGFSREEFEIAGDGVRGDWILNAISLGGIPAESPLFLRCRVVFNFGKAGQHEQEFLLRLQEKGRETQLAKINVE